MLALTLGLMAGCGDQATGKEMEESNTKVEKSENTDGESKGADGSQAVEDGNASSIIEYILLRISNIPLSANYSA